MRQKIHPIQSEGLFFLGLGLLVIALRLLLPSTEGEVRQASSLLAGLFLAGRGAFRLAWIHGRRGLWRVAGDLCAGLCLAAFAVYLWFSRERLHDLVLFAILAASLTAQWFWKKNHPQENSGGGE